MENLVLHIPETERKSTEREFYPNAYIAIPPNGKACAITGLKHAHLYKLLTGKGKARDYVRVVNLKVPGANKGKTLFHSGDMLRFLDKLALDQNSGIRRANPLQDK